MRWLLPVAGFLLAARVSAQATFSEDEVLVHAHASAFDHLGISVAFDGDATLLGWGNGPGPVGGFLFAEGADGWQQQLTATLPIAGGCSLGSAAVMSEGRAVLSDPDRDTSGFCLGAGALLLFEQVGDTWTQRGVQLPPPGIVRYGADLALRGDHLLAGASLDDPQQGPFAKGRVVAHDLNAGVWVPTQRFAASDTVDFDGFGTALALSPDGLTAVIGAPTASPGGVSAAGRAYVFRRIAGEWVEQQPLVASDPSPLDTFGRAVAVDGDWIAVGVQFDDTSVSDGGSVYVFHFDGNTWVQVQNFTAPGLQAGDYFGHAVAMEGATLAVSANNANRAFLYRRLGNGFSPLQVLQVSPEGSSTTLGTSIALSGKRCLVGDQWSNAGATGAGAAYLFQVQDLALTADAGAVPAGSPVTLTVRGGLPGTPCAVGYHLRGAHVTTAVAGPATVFGPEGAYTTTITMPPGLAGQTLVVRAAGSFGPDQAGTSNTLLISVL
jgi:hypothetical protein